MRTFIIEPRVQESRWPVRQPSELRVQTTSPLDQVYSPFRHCGHIRRLWKVKLTSEKDKMSTTRSFPADQVHNEPWLDMTRYPGVFDIVSIKRFLAHILPNELIDEILDLAEYWPHVSHNSPSPIKAQGRMPEDVLNRPLR